MIVVINNPGMMRYLVHFGSKSDFNCWGRSEPTDSRSVRESVDSDGVLYDRFHICQDDLIHTKERLEPRKRQQETRKDS